MSNTGAFLVSGAGSGIGQAIALQLISSGHHVFGLGRDVTKLQHTAQLSQDADRFHVHAVDLSLPRESLLAVQAIRWELKAENLSLCGLVNNAGVFARHSFFETDDEFWTAQFQNNLLSAVRLTREFYPELKLAAARSTAASVLNISSTLGLRPVANTLAYSAIKAAMVNWSRGLALEWAPDRIRVNCLCPGLVDTPIHAFHHDREDSSERQSAHQMQPLGRLGTAQDIAAAACFLLSPDSAWTTGSVMSVDGGISL